MGQHQAVAIKGAKVQIVVTCEPHFYGHRLGNLLLLLLLAVAAAFAKSLRHQEFIVRAVNGVEQASVWASASGHLYQPASQPASSTIGTSPSS